VVVLARSADKLERVCQSLATGQQQTHSFIAVDASDTTALSAAVAAELEKGSLHIWVNNTGGPAPGPAHLANPAAYSAAFEQHLVAAQTLLQLLLPGMRAAGYGRILNVLSTSVKTPIPNLGVSNSIRAAMANWAKTLAGELGRDGITVNCVLPGLTQTARLDSLIEHMAQASGRTVDEVSEGMRATVPVRRFGKPEEFANAIGFLASPAAGFINGANLPVDGGSTVSL